MSSNGTKLIFLNNKTLLGSFSKVGKSPVVSKYLYHNIFTKTQYHYHFVILNDLVFASELIIEIIYIFFVVSCI